MSDQTSIFNEQQVVTPQQSNQSPASSGGVPPNEPFADLLKSITNERGEQKYGNLPDALKGLQHSQQFIQQLKDETSSLKSELERLKSELASRRSVEDAVAELTSRKAPQGTTNPQGLTEEAVADLVERTLSTRETVTQQKKNLQSVVNAMSQKFGNTAEQEFYTRANSVGLSAKQVNELAAQSPSAVFKLLGLDAPQGQPKEQSAAPLGTSVNTGGYQPQQDTFIRKNGKGVMLGATTQDFKEEFENAKKLVEELETKGLTTYDLTDPKVYYKFFK